MDHLFIHLDRHGLAFAKYRLFFTATNISRHLQSPTYLPIVFTNKTLNFCDSSNRKLYIIAHIHYTISVVALIYQYHPQYYYTSLSYKDYIEIIHSIR